jgi:ketosteroid isomerase-like protein
MAGENVELVRSLLRAWNERRDPCFDAYHEDAEWDFSGWDFAVKGTWRGVGAMEDLIDALSDGWEELRVEPDEFIDGGDKVAFVGRFFARRRDSGLEVSDSGTCVFTMRAGKVAAFQLFRDRARALSAIGVSTDAEGG